MQEQVCEPVSGGSGVVGWWIAMQAPRGGYRLAVGGNRGLRLAPELLGGGRRVCGGKGEEEEPTGRVVVTPQGEYPRRGQSMWEEEHKLV